MERPKRRAAAKNTTSTPPEEGLLSSIFVYIDKESFDDADEFDTNQEMLSQAEANICTRLSNKVTHCVTKTNDLTRDDISRALTNVLTKYPNMHIVPPDYFQACIQQSKMIDLDGFQLDRPSKNRVQDEEEQNDTKPPRELSEKAKGKRKAQVEPEPESTAIEEPVEQVERIVKTIRKGRAAVDHVCPVAKTTHVFEDGNDVYDAMLNQTNISQNNNKFYIIQMLQGDNKTSYYVWRRWGRVGANGQTDLENHGNSVESAKSSFRKKFFDKTKNHWDNRENFQHVQGKYDMLERDYGAHEKDDHPSKDKKAKKETPEVPKSTLPDRLQNLMTMIFDISMMSSAMVEIGYDANKMPLGKLTADHVNKGYDILRQIADVLNSPNRSSTDLSHLSSRFYTLIPHDFGRNKPPIIQSHQMLKEKLQMVESLADIQIATSILKAAESAILENPIDLHYKSLKNIIQPLEPSSDMWNLIQLMTQNTHAPTHTDYALEIQDIFELKRDGEEEGFKNHGEKIENRLLLWHGSRLSNWVGILSQGLRIAPPEAPATGYMFGKGVYFADMVSKSSNYCFATPSAPEGLLLLCEVAIGKTIDYKQSEYSADKHVRMEKRGDSAKGCGATVPDPSDVREIELDGGKTKLKAFTGKPVKTNVHGGLLYNEYIVYDVHQIKMRYLVKVKFNFRKRAYHY